MRNSVRIPIAALVILLGLSMFVYGGFDDSPGGQLLGLVIVGAGLYYGIRGMRGLWRR